MKFLYWLYRRVLPILCGSILLFSCHKEEQSTTPSTAVSGSACADLTVQHFDPPRTISVPCDDMNAPAIVAVDSIDVNADGVADLRVTYSSHVVFPGGGGAYWTCYGSGRVSGLDSTEIVDQPVCNVNCQGALGPTDTVRPDDPTTSVARLHIRDIYQCNCYSSPGSIGFIKHIDGHTYCGYVEVSDSWDDIRVIRTVFGNCPDKPVVISE